MLTSSALNAMHAIQTELANSVAVINSVATVSVQLLFKCGRNSAYACIDCQLAIRLQHTLSLSQGLFTCCMNTTHGHCLMVKVIIPSWRSLIKESGWCLFVRKCVCVNIRITWR